MSDPVERWLQPGETVIWSDRQRPRLLGWPPRSPGGMFLFALLGSAVLIALGIAALAWRDATGFGSALGPVLVTGLAIAVLGLGSFLAVVTLLDPREQYALARNAEGKVFAYAIGRRHATRFLVERPPAVSGSERGEVDWGRLRTEILTPSAWTKDQWVRWTEVAYPHVVAELVAGQLPSR